MNGYIDVYYKTNFLISELDYSIRNPILKKIYFLVYSYLEGSIIIDGKIYKVEYFDDGNIDDDGLKNIYFRVSGKIINKDRFINIINEFYDKNIHILKGDITLSIDYINVIFL